MKTLKGSNFLLLTLLVASFANAMQIKAPDIAENGAVIPIEIWLDQAMTAGQVLELIVNGEPAAQVRVMEGKLSRFSIRVKGSQNDTSILARVITKGRELDSASRNVDVRITSPVSGSPTTAGPFRVRTNPGDLKILMESQNGFSDTFVVQDTGFRVLISGSRVITKNPYVGVMGEFSDRATAAVDEQARWTPSNPVAPPASLGAGDDPTVVGGSYRP